MGKPAANPAKTAPPAPASWNSIWPIGAATIIVVFLLVALFGERGILRELNYRHQRDQLQQELHQLEAQNEDLRKEIDTLRHNGKYVETIARRELGMVKPDEIIYQFPHRTEPTTTPASPLPPR